MVGIQRLNRVFTWIGDKGCGKEHVFVLKLHTSGFLPIFTISAREIGMKRSMRISSQTLSAVGLGLCRGGGNVPFIFVSEGSRSRRSNIGAGRYK